MGRNDAINYRKIQLPSSDEYLSAFFYVRTIIGFIIILYLTRFDLI